MSAALCAPKAVRTEPAEPDFRTLMLYWSKLYATPCIHTVSGVVSGEWYLESIMWQVAYICI